MNNSQDTQTVKGIVEKKFISFKATENFCMKTENVTEEVWI